MGTPTTFATPPATPPARAELMPELSDVPELLASGDYLVTRPGATSMSHGVVVDGTPRYFWSTGSLSPTNGQDVMRLPEGLRMRESKAFITADALRGLEADTPPDQMTIDGVLFEVSQVQEWQQIAGFTRAILTRIPA